MNDSLRLHHIIYGEYRFSDEYNSAAYRNIHAAVGSTSRFVRTNSAITAELQTIVIRKLECICNFHFANKIITNCKITHAVYLYGRQTYSQFPSRCAQKYQSRYFTPRCVWCILKHPYPGEKTFKCIIYKSIKISSNICHKSIASPF